MRIEEERRKKTKKGRSRRNDPEELKTDVRTAQIVPENQLLTESTVGTFFGPLSQRTRSERPTDRQVLMASAAKARSKKLAINKDGLNRLLEELEQLCLAPAHISEIKEQVSMTEELYRVTDALQTELEQDLEGEEQQCAMEDWSNTGNLDCAPWLSRREENGQRMSTAARFGRPNLVAREHLSALWKAPACRHLVTGGRDDVAPAMSQVAGQGPLHEPLPRERRVGSQEVTGVRPKDSLSTPVEEGVRESDRRTEYRTSSKKSPRPKWNNGGHITLSVAAVSVTRGCPFCQADLSESVD
ncbi:conserved hypothetical protein [Trichinella spiralis]|uniref:hypothetical protein n=1 Tax=Trichinella spiralis TaxID=6334 RepID=UPI0001EFC36D|nr:conserved hypothetical protein [Trichinella spiralis]